LTTNGAQSKAGGRERARVRRPAAGGKNSAVLKRARKVLEIEADAVRQQARRLNGSFEKAVELLCALSGRVAVIGIGKSGLVGRKIAATLSSTGTPAIFLHPVETLHGDLGMLTANDIVLALSYSGQTDEIKRALPHLRSQGLKIIAMTGRSDSPLAREADLLLSVPIREEACPYNITPTASTTAMLAVGDALAISAMERRGFGKDDFARLHPGGALGKGLSLLVGDLMRKGRDNPVSRTSDTVKTALAVMTRTGLGATSVVDGGGRLVGYFTDGDIRRLLPRDPKLLRRRLSEVMSRNPSTLRPDQKALEAARLIERRQIDNIPVVDPKNGRPVGILDERDILAAGLR
jgi:arabinose-5-phosphate isomerase